MEVKKRCGITGKQHSWNPLNTKRFGRHELDEMMDPDRNGDVEEEECVFTGDEGVDDGVLD